MPMHSDSSDSQVASTGNQHELTILQRDRIDALLPILDWTPGPPPMYPPNSLKGKLISDTETVEFYSLHLAESLQLNTISPCPDLFDVLKWSVDERLREITSEGAVLPDVEPLRLQTRSLHDRESRPALSIRAGYIHHPGGEPESLYSKSTIDLCGSIASTLLLCPSLSVWINLKRIMCSLRTAHERKSILYPPILLKSQIFGTPGYDPHHEAISEAIVENNVAWASFLLRAMDSPAIQEDQAHHPWELAFLVTSDYNGLRIDSHRNCRWKTARHSSHLPSLITPGHVKRCSVPQDALGLWLKQGVGRPRLSKPDLDKDGNQTNFPDALLQDIWYRAVLSDSTVIMILIDDAQHICIRDRARKTLHVSPPLVPHLQKEYGKIHVGLHLLGLRDLIERARLADIAEKKRTRSDSDRPVINDSEPTLAIRGEFETRPHIQLWFNYGIYRSKHPSTLSRPESWSSQIIDDRPKGPATRSGRFRSDHEEVSKTLLLVLTSHLGRGATGTAHGGSLMIPQTSQGIAVAVKLAITTQDAISLSEEMKTYRQLYANGVSEGIPTVFGYFCDKSRSVAALVMSKHGRRLGISPPKGSLSYEMHGKVSAHDCLMFAQILRRIHKAGVQHGDLRRENLLTDGNGGVVIIDFHCSRRFRGEVPEKESDKELGQLWLLLAENLRYDR